MGGEVIKYVFRKFSREQLAKMAENAIKALADKRNFDVFTVTLDVDGDESDMEVAEARKDTNPLHKGCNMTERDSNGELHPVVPHPFEGGVFLVIVQDDKTATIEKLEAFERESDALNYAKSLDKSKLKSTLHLLKVH
jgi:hypothetical protein